MKQTWKQIGSLFLSVCMVVTMLPVTAFAEIGTKDSGAGLGASGEITAFAALDEDIAVQTVDLGTAENKLNLPKKLKVTVTKTVTTTTGSAVTATVSGNDTATGSEAKKQEQQEETKEITEETTVEVSGWTSAPDYDGDVEGDYLFTPALVLPEGLTLAEDVNAPTVTVKVGEEPAVPQARGAAAPLGAGESITINETNFPDANFREWLLDSENLDGKGANGTLTSTEIASVTTLNVGEEDIASLAGLEYFTALTSLYCRLNKLTTLPELPSGLERLNCSYNSLNELPTLPSGLIEIYCNDNKLTALPELPSSLEWLFCGSNALKTLPELPSTLTELICNGNKLTGITLNGSAIYTKINVSKNYMTATNAVTGQSIDWCSADNTSGDANFVFYPQTTDTPATPLVAPTGLAWDGATPGKAKWNAVDNASEYRIQLYKDDTEQGNPASVAATVTEYDFTSAITTAGAGSYTFKVQAMGDGTTWSDGPQSIASAEYNYTPGGASVDVSTENQLKDALESTTAKTINVTSDMQGFYNTTILGADHTLNIADGKTVSIENSQFQIPEGKTLTLSGTGTLHVNPTSGSDIYVRGTLKLTVGSKLLSSSGLYLDDGMLVSTGGHITINNSGENSFGISNGAVTLSGGSLTIKNTGGQGISGVKLTVKDNCSVNVANVGDSYGMNIFEASFEGSTLNVANSVGYGISTNQLTITDCTVTATNTSGTGISVFDNNGNGNLTLKNSTIHLKNTGGMSVGRDATLMVDGSTINVDNGSELGINSDGYLTGLNGGKLVLAVGARIVSVDHILSDRGYPYKYTGTATVIADNDTPSVEKLTAGEYVWNGSLFLKGTAAPTYSITVTGGTAYPDTARGGAFVALVPDEPPAGQHFKEWHCTGGNATFQYDETMSVWFFTMPHENVTVEAIFEVNPTAAYTVTVNGGTATPATAAVGETVTLTADAAPNGQRFSQWSISPAVTFTDGTDEYSESASFIMPNEAVTAMAAYEQDTSIALSILGTFVKADYKGNITGPGISGGVSYDPATKTLTLNNAVISPSSGSEYGIFSQDDLTVKLVGQNRIGEAPNNPASKSDYNVGVGIQSNKSLSITGEGSLTIYDSVMGLYGVDALTVDIGGRLIVTEYGDEHMSCCLRTEGVLTIKRGSLDLTSYNSKGLKGDIINIEGGIISAQTEGGEHFAFSTAPSFGGGYIPSVFAGENAASAVKVTGPTAATFTASKYVRIQPVGAETYTITLNANGGSVSPTTMQTNVDGKLTSLPAPIRSGSYRFDGWFTAASGGTKVTESTVFRTNTTIYAHWTDTSDSGGNGGGSGSGGGSSSGGSSGSTTTPTTTTPGKTPNQPVTAAAPVTATAGQNGSASASIPEKSIADAIAKAQADAKAQGKTANGTTVALNVTMPKGATSLTANLTRNSLNSLVSAGVTSLELNGSPVTVSFDTKALAEIQKQSSGNISITIVPNAKLSASAKAMIGTRPVYDLTVSYQKDGKNATVSSFGGGTATVSVPYTPAKGEAIGGLYAVYVDAKGNATRIAGSAYDANSGCVMFTTTHFSLYGIGYTAPSAKFADITTHWGKESIDYVVGRGLLSGTAETTFAPDTAMTRGMLVTALGRLAGVDTKAYATNSFTDVKADSAFRPYIEWAYKKGVVQGTGNGKFEPDRAITREEIAVVFANFAKATGYTLPVTRNATTYADASSIGSTYQTAVTAMQQAGIMMGGTSNKFNPKSSATRAEVSSLLHRYIKLTIDPATAQGWAKNDAGQYLYYKDGKALTGTQTINGVKYFFNTDGTLKTGWVKDDTGNWRFYSGNTMLVGFWDLGANGNNKTYYFTKDGIMVAGKWLEVDGKWYYLNADGTLARSTKIDDYEVDEKGVRKTK